MSLTHAKPGEVIDLALGRALAGAQTTTLAKTANLELIRLVLPEGKEIPTHHVAGELTVQCLEGRVAFTAGEATRELAAGQLLYLAGGAPHALRALDDSSLLVTILVATK